MKNKLIVIEGTDCSGKQTQSELLIKKLNALGISIKKYSFPNYDSPTGKIIGAQYLGKPAMGESVFKEGPAEVSPYVAGAYYVADRFYNMPTIKGELENCNVVLDRYVDSNMAHQAGKLLNKKLRKRMYRWFEKLEYGLYKLPKPDIRILLYVPFEVGESLRKNREEKLDGLEASSEHLMCAERAYLEIAKRNKYKLINCSKDGVMRSIEDINEELLAYVLKKLKRGSKK